MGGIRMAAAIIDGKAIGAEIQAELAQEAAALRARGIRPALSVVLVGDDPASHTYVRSKLNTAQRLGMESRDYFLPATTSQAELLELVQRLNADPEVHGILVQLPLPAQLDSRAILLAVDPRKDVDGLHPANVGALVTGGETLPPCTPAGVMELVRRAGVELAGKEAVVVGRSNLVGRPAALMLLHQNATVTMCHSKTVDLPGVCRRADVLVVAIGCARMVTPDYVKEGAVVIDVGTNRVDGK